VNVMLPLAPETRLSGLPAVPVSDCVTVPVFTGVGGFGLAAMPFCVPVVRLVTVITSRKLEPAASAVIGLPERSVSWNVTPYERSVHPPGLLTVEVPSEVKGGPVEVVVKELRTSRSVSFASWVVLRIVIEIAKVAEPPAGIAFAHEVAWNVTDVVVKAVRLQPAGAAVPPANTEPELIRKRTR